MIGFGGELSVLSFKPNLRMWISKTTGIEIFGGIASELEDIDPNDVEGGFKFLHAFQYNRTDRTYFGLVGKWKWVNAFDPNRTTNLPVPGIIVGKEWFSKKRALKGLAVELGYQFGTKEYTIYSPAFNDRLPSKQRFEEFPLILNLRYSFYRKK
ncbi:MAG TPA: hypothetical protein DCR40_05620 [Prolixibacteraceae bacterium]|nr:hypothetical protein [Prolixibacteraceae bacterium]